MNLKEKFTDIYQRNLFNGDESRSGIGSNIYYTESIRQNLPILIDALKIRTVIDAPCGDWNWMRNVNLEVDKYIGVDIVQELIDKNNERYATSVNEFQCLNIVDYILPKVDLIFCRACFTHLCFDDIFKVLENFKKSESKYLLTTSFFKQKENYDLGGRIWRSLNLEKEPFNFSNPLLYIYDLPYDFVGNYNDKTLGLWELQKIGE